MKKFLSATIFLLLACNISFADYGIWSCQKISGDNYKCTNTVDNMKVEYIGDIKNNEPHGYGKLLVINEDISAKGTWKTDVDNTPTLIEGIKKFYGTDIFYRNSKAYKLIYKSGEIFKGKLTESGSKIITEGILYYTNGDTFNGFIKSVWKRELINGTYSFKDGDSYIGTWNNSKYDNGIYYFSNGKSLEYINGKVKKNSSKYSKKNQSSDNFMSSFVWSWVFAIILWGIIIFYFMILGTIGKLTKKIDKKILFNFVFIYMAIWGSMTVFVLNIVSNLIESKLGNYITLFLGACSLALSIERIGPFIKFLKNI